VGVTKKSDMTNNNKNKMSYKKKKKEYISTYQPQSLGQLAFFSFIRKWKDKERFRDEVRQEMKG